MRNVTTVIETIIKLVPRIDIGEDATDREAFVVRLEKLRRDSAYTAPESSAYFEKLADALDTYLFIPDKKYKEIIGDYFSDKITMKQAFETYNQFYQ